MYVGGFFLALIAAGGYGCGAMKDWVWYGCVYHLKVTGAQPLGHY